jgi:hypothetical protein
MGKLGSSVQYYNAGNYTIEHETSFRVKVPQAEYEHFLSVSVGDLR